MSLIVEQTRELYVRGVCAQNKREREKKTREGADRDKDVGRRRNQTPPSDRGLRYLPEETSVFKLECFNGDRRNRTVSVAADSINIVTRASIS